ncbi:MAG: TRAP transporter small permease [Clostridiales Family XIII bacterium]|jgi:TRAP-type C4-dicarboxylate transport system permease small subunit|nr:TRAP transporter small permease [Clostridiales Family XIII bacterium]
MRGILAKTISALGTAAAAVLFVSTILSAYNTVGRVLFTTSLAWIEELSCYAAGFIMFIMLPCLEYSDRHLSIAFLDEKFKAKGSIAGRRALFYVRGAVTVFIFLVLAAAGFRTFMRNYAIGAKSPTLEFPYGTLYLILFVCVALALALWAFHFFLKQWGEENGPE